jgi:hypothetical protein
MNTDLKNEWAYPAPPQNIDDALAILERLLSVNKRDVAWEAWVILRAAITPQPQASAEDVADALYAWMVGRLPNGALLNASVVCDHAGAVAFKRELAERIRASLGVEP